ncbi:hypothetical protein [Arenimonas sp. MALMAid1274]|uniref:hypothetical protein n=1 Tax=Arenimonas sp. MALMAid1274 TaxID=3411630 RepID=UPI003B9F4F27
MWLMAALAPASLLSSALPLAVSVPLSGLATAWAVRLAWREGRRAPRVFEWAGGDAPAKVGQGASAQAWDQVRVHLRGPLASASGRGSDGRRLHLVWWPDTLSPAARRQLRLAVQVSRRSGKPLRQLAA